MRFWMCFPNMTENRGNYSKREYIDSIYSLDYTEHRFYTQIISKLVPEAPGMKQF